MEGSASRPPYGANAAGLTRPIAGDTNARDLVEIRRFFDYGATGVSDTRGEFAFLADRPPSDWEKITERADIRRFSRGDCELLRLSMTRGSRRRTRAEVPYTADYFFWKKKGA